MKKILLISLFALIHNGFAAPVKIGFINIDHVLTGSPQFIDASKRISEEFKPKEAALAELSKKIKNLVNILRKEEEGLSEDEIKTRIDTISELEISFKKQLTELQDAFDRRNQYELEKIQDLINEVVTEVAKEHEFDLILYQDVAYVNDKLNISKTISKKLRDAFK